MEIGLIGLGKMGGNMAERLRRDGHQVVGYDRNPDSARDIDSLEALAAALAAPRVVWVMVPSGEPTRATVASLGEALESGSAADELVASECHGVLPVIFDLSHVLDRVRNEVCSRRGSYANDFACPEWGHERGLGSSRKLSGFLSDSVEKV